MVTFDSFSAYDVEKDLMRFRCHFQDQVILCGVTRAALVAGAEHPVKTRAELAALYEARTEVIQRAVLNRLQRRNRAEDGPLIIDVNDVFQLVQSAKSEKLDKYATMG
jgi:hypothetical protein